MGPVGNYGSLLFLEVSKLDDDRIVYDGLKDFGVRMWVKEGEFCFKYPEGVEGEGRKDLFKFIKAHEEGLKRIVEAKNGN